MGGQLHKDVDFVVENKARNLEQVFKSFEDAAAAALDMSLSSGQSVNLDLLCWTRAGFQAASKAGFVGYSEYDPECSVTRRFSIKVTDKGKVN